MKSIINNSTYLSLKCINWIVFLLLILGFHSCKNSHKDLPNIVIIFIDDLGYADPSCYGATAYSTPNIDRLAEEGARFTNFYASQAVCSASRGSLLTGCYSERIGIQGALSPYSKTGIHSNETTIAEMLKDKGYISGIFGKWHLGHHHEFLPLQHGFDEFIGLPYSNDMWPVNYDGLPKKSSDYPPLPLFEGNEVIDSILDLDDQANLTTLYTENAIQFIDKHKDEPFFLYIPHSMVHVPIAVSEKFKGKSKNGLFADVMMELDWSVGEILKALERNGLEENTLVIFTSDNGPWLNYGNHAGSALPLREGKGNMWEGGPRVSAIMKWPEKIESGIQIDQIASSIDILPTISDITSSELPINKIDGVSILALLKGDKDANPRNHFCYYYGGDLIAVRKDNWKLVFPHRYRSYDGITIGKDGFPGNYTKGIVEQKELYNLETDISEANNIIDEYPEIVKELDQIADNIRFELGDNLLNRSGSENRKAGRIKVEKIRSEHIAIHKNVILDSELSSKYASFGSATLTNGILGSLDYSDNEWLGFHGVDFEAVVDLEEVQQIKEISIGFMENQKSWIFLPIDIQISYSNDNIHFTDAKHFSFDKTVLNNKRSVQRFDAELPSMEMRYIKISAQNRGICPDWHAGAGEKSWIFVDEIEVR